MAERDYTTGAPVGITVNDETGEVSVIVYLGEVSQGIADDDWRVPVILDALIVIRALDDGRVTVTYDKGA